MKNPDWPLFSLNSHSLEEYYRYNSCLGQEVELQELQHLRACITVMFFNICEEKVKVNIFREGIKI